MICSVSKISIFAMGITTVQTLQTKIKIFVKNRCFAEITNRSKKFQMLFLKLDELFILSV